MQISEPRPVGARTDSGLMRIKLCAETHTKASQRASASNSAADSRAAIRQVTWKQYQKHGLRETRVLRLQGQDEVLFQFCNSQGWKHAECIGTITPYQAWLALKKLRREDYDVTKAKVDFALWEESGASSRRDNSQSSGQNGVASNGAHQQLENGRHSQHPAAAGSVSAYAEDTQAVNGGLWDQPASAAEQVDDDVHGEEDGHHQRGQKRRFWQFNNSRPEPEPLIQPARKQKASKRRAGLNVQQPKEVDMSASSLSSRSAKPGVGQLMAEQGIGATAEQTEALHTTPDGWTVINDSLADSAINGSEGDKPLVSLSSEEMLVRRLDARAAEIAQGGLSSIDGEHGDSKGSERSEAVPEAFDSAKEQQPEGAAASRASEEIQATAKQKESSSLWSCLGLSAKRFLGFFDDRIKGILRGIQSVLKRAARSAQVAFWASLFLLRKAAWAIVGQPGPPLVHASAQIAQLCRCWTLPKAQSLSLKLGYDETGKKANPLEDLPRWRVESLVGTFVLDMSLYRRALTAPSAVPDSITASYERLEYLGDGILEGIIRQFIYSRWPEVTEHAMCAMVSGLVSGRTLHDFARGLHLQRCLALDVAGQWEAKHLSGWADGMLADSFEALLAALFMDRGFNAARALVMRLIEDFVELERLPYNRDYKGILGNIMSIGRLGRPRYRCRLVRMPEAEAQKFSLVPSKAALPGSQELLWEAAVQMRRGTWASPMVLGKAYDIRRATAEQQAARLALQSLGLQIKELSLVEANQMSMAQIASNMPGLSVLKGAAEGSTLGLEDYLAEEKTEAAGLTSHDSRVVLSDGVDLNSLDLAADLSSKQQSRKGKARAAVDNFS